MNPKGHKELVPYRFSSLLYRGTIVVEDNRALNTACGFLLPPLSGAISRNAQVTVTVVEVEGAVVTEGPSSSAGTGGGVTTICEPPTEISPSLAPGESLECTASTTVIQDDVNRAEV